MQLSLGYTQINYTNLAFGAKQIFPFASKTLAAATETRCSSEEEAW